MRFELPLAGQLKAVFGCCCLDEEENCITVSDKGRIAL